MFHTFALLLYTLIISHTTVIQFVRDNGWRFNTSHAVYCSRSAKVTGEFIVRSINADD